MSASAAASAALRRRRPRPPAPAAGRRDGPIVVGELGLLLEVRQLLVVELVAPVGDRLQLVHQRLRLAWRGDRAQLRLEPRALGGERPRRRARGRRWPAPAPAPCSCSRAGGSAVLGERGLVLRRRDALGQVGPAVGELVGRRVEALQLQQVVGQHPMTVLVSGAEGSGTRGSSTSGGIVVWPGIGTRRVTIGAVMSDAGGQRRLRRWRAVGGGGGGGGGVWAGRRNPAGGTGRRAARCRATSPPVTTAGREALVARQVQPRRRPGVGRRRPPSRSAGRTPAPGSCTPARSASGSGRPGRRRRLAPSNSGMFSIGV